MSSSHTSTLEASLSTWPCRVVSRLTPERPSRVSESCAGYSPSREDRDCGYWPWASRMTVCLLQRACSCQRRLSWNVWVAGRRLSWNVCWVAGRDSVVRGIQVWMSARVILLASLLYVDRKDGPGLASLIHGCSTGSELDGSHSRQTLDSDPRQTGPTDSMAWRRRDMP